MARFSSALNRFVRGGDAATLKASGAETASTTGSAVDIGEAGARMVTVDVTAASGTSPTLEVRIEAQVDGTNWVQVGRVDANGGAVGDSIPAVSAITGVTTKRVMMPLPGGLVRYRSIIGGTTPSFTYSVAIA